MAVGEPRREPTSGPGTRRGREVAAGRLRAYGEPTRGTTAPNRLRRLDRWIVDHLGGSVRSAADPLVVDLGYGSSPATTIELHARLARIRADVTVLGLELDAQRVAVAQPAARTGLRFERAGFELAGHRPVLVRAANVLRQYPEAAVTDAWTRMQAQLQPDGIIVEATSDEYGRRSSWILLNRDAPLSVTLSCSLQHLAMPSAIADRLVKVLIHRNVAGEGVHRLLTAMDRAWDVHAALAPFGAGQRWQAMCQSLSSDWPVLSNRRDHRLGAITVAWSAVAPLGWLG